MSVPAVDFPDEPTARRPRPAPARRATVRSVPVRDRVTSAATGAESPRTRSIAAPTPRRVRPADRSGLIPRPRPVRPVVPAIGAPIAPAVEPRRSAGPATRRDPVVGRPVRTLPPLVPAVREAVALGQVTIVGQAPMSGRARPHPVDVRPESQQRHRLRLTHRARLLLAVAVAAVVAGGAYLTQQASSGVLTDAPSNVVVQPGDTLYSIATRVAPDADPRVVVDELRAANDLSASEVGSLTPGDTLVVPTG